MNPITTVRLQSLSSTDQMQVPFTFGQVFKNGDLAPTDGLAAGGMPLQVDVKALHADGSVRHAIISGVLPKLKAGETAVLELIKAPAKQNPAFSLAGLSLPDAKVSLTIGTDTYTASLAGAELTSFIPWLAGAVVVEGFAVAPMKNAQGVEHPLLQVGFGVRYYLATKQVRVEFIVENDKTFITNSNVVYDVDLTLAGKTVYSAKSLTHYRRARWHQYFWTGASPAVNVQFDTSYLIQTKAIPNYEMANQPWDGLLNETAAKIGSGNTGPMQVGPTTAYMPMTGGRDDIGSLPSWSVQWLLSMDKRARDVMLAAADGSGTWSIHLRDENTGYPVRTDNEINKNISTHGNLADTGPLAVPRESGDTRSPFTAETAHQPSLAYLPYMVTGEYFYLEELQFWASSNPLETAPSNHGYGKGLLRWQQLRGQAWSMRTLGEVAYITPDKHPLKDYFLWQLNNNLDFYYQTYVVGNPNKLGLYDNSGEGAFEIDGIAPWQDDFFTWSFAHLSELGFQKATAIRDWKTKFVIGRMTDPGFCWIAASDYFYWFRDSRNSPVYDTFAQIYQKTRGEDMRNEDSQPVAKDIGRKFVSLPCAGPEQSTILSSINPGFYWEPGRMMGYADSPIGYPANMQPALAAAVDTGNAKAAEGWAKFMTRKNKPDYRRAPQWAVLPRSAPNPAPPLFVAETPLVPLVDVVQGFVADGTWKKLADEGASVTEPVGTVVRYGHGDKWIVAKVRSGSKLTANNAAFGSDPLPNVVKEVQVFVPAEVARVGKIKSPSNKKLAKLKGLQVTVIDPVTLAVVKVFDGITASSTGILTLSGEALAIGAVYALKVADAKGSILDIMYPLTATK